MDGIKTVGGSGAIGVLDEEECPVNERNADPSKQDDGLVYVDGSDSELCSKVVRIYWNEITCAVRLHVPIFFEQRRSEIPE